MAQQCYSWGVHVLRFLSISPKSWWERSVPEKWSVEQQFPADADPCEVLGMNPPLIHHLLSPGPDLSQPEGSALPHSAEGSASLCDCLEWNRVETVPRNTLQLEWKESRLNWKLKRASLAQIQGKHPSPLRKECSQCTTGKKLSGLSRMLFHLLLVNLIH